MELGKKIFRARQEAGISQRQLCGEEITRNMLSQIEHGKARPSMTTLKYLAARLGKPVSYFLDEEDPPVPQNEVLEALTLLRKAEAALHQGKHIYVSDLLEKVTDPTPEIQRRKLLLLSQLPGADAGEICAQLPSLDEELLLRAKAALENDKWSRCLHLLEAMEDHSAPQWHMLRGGLYLRQKEYSQAAKCFHHAEDTFPKETAAYLEQCYRELEDFKQAYFYACKQK